MNHEDKQAATHCDHKNPNPKVANPKAEFTEADAAAASQAAAVTVIPAKEQKRASLHWQGVSRVAANS